MATPTAITLTEVSKRYRVYHRRHQSLKELVLRRSRGEWVDLWALKEVSVEVPKGQMLGVIGENGAGKSTMLKVLAGILRPDGGKVITGGRVSSLLELGAGFQPEYTGRENIYLYGVLLGLRRKEVRRQFDEIVEFSELGGFIDQPVKSYSSGMYMRLGFAVAVHLEPDILLLDEILAVGDASFQKKCFEHLRKLRERGVTIVLVSHDLDSVRNFCERVIWLDRGRIAADGSPDASIKSYLELSADRAQGTDQLPGFEPAPGEVEVQSVRWLNRRRERSHAYETGEPLTLEVACRSRSEHKKIEVSVNVYRNDGVLVAHNNNDVDGVPLSLPAGESVLSLHFPHCRLRSGVYDINLAIYDPVSRRLFAFHSRRHPFTVRDGDGYGGVTELEREWSVAATSPERQRGRVKL